MENWGAGEMERWRAGELGSWRAGEFEKWRAGELESWGAVAWRKMRSLPGGLEDVAQPLRHFCQAVGGWDF